MTIKKNTKWKNRQTGETVTVIDNTYGLISFNNGHHCNEDEFKSNYTRI